MLIVLLEFLFMLLCLLPPGMTVLHLIGVRKEIPSPVHAVFAGYAFAVVFALCWSFFARVDPWASAALFAVALTCAMWQWSRWRSLFGEWMRKLSTMHVASKAAFGMVVLIAVVKASGPSEMVDEGGYYMPYIKWVERFPLVPGLANVEDRMGFNSAHHVVSALFSFDALGDGGYYDLNALLLIATASWLVGGLEQLVRGGAFGAFAVGRICCLFLLMRNMLTSATSDLPMMLLGQTVLLLFLQRLEQRRTADADGMGMLLLLYAFLAIIIKFSALPLVLPGLWVLYRQWRAGVPLPVLRSMVLVLVLFGPWMLRSYHLSGYLIYPLYQINLFHPDWRVPRSVIETQFHYVSEFARTNARWDESRRFALERGFSTWFPLWYARESVQGLFFFWALVAGCLWTIIRGASAMVKRSVRMDVAFIMGVLLFGLALWFYRHPSFRFGWAWVLVFLAVVLFDVGQRFGLLRPLRWALMLGLGVALSMNLISSVREHRGQLVGRLFRPAPPPTAEVVTDERWGYPVRITEGTQCWATAPPCFTITDIRHVEARGPRPEDGFRWVRKAKATAP